MELPYWSMVRETTPVSQLNNGWLAAGTESSCLIAEVRYEPYFADQQFIRGHRLTPYKTKTIRLDSANSTVGFWMRELADSLAVPDREAVQALEHYAVVPPLSRSRKRGFLSWGWNDPVLLVPGRAPVPSDQIPAYIQHRAFGVPSPALRAEVEARVEAIQRQFFALREDVVYRIENSALFDPAEPLTAALETALLRWADRPAGVSVDQLAELAGEVEVSFAVARDNAEAKGFSHLPSTAREPARRAAGAARLGLKAGTEGERIAALTRAAAILDDLAVSYLPRDLAPQPKLEPPR